MVATRQQRRMSKFTAAALATAVLVALTVPSTAAALSPPAPPVASVVANPGPVKIGIVGGELLAASGVALPLPSCGAEAEACVWIDGEVLADGRLIVDERAVDLPAVDVPLGELGVPVSLRVDPYLRPTSGSVVSPAGQLVRLGFELGATVAVDLSGLGLGPLLGGVDLSCSVGPVRVNLTSGVSGPLTGVPLDPDTGAASLVDGALTVPPLTCSPFVMSTLPMLVNSGLLSSVLPGGFDINALLGEIDLGALVGGLDLGDLDLGGLDLGEVNVGALLGDLGGITLDLSDPRGSLNSVNAALNLPTAPGAIGVRLNVVISQGTDPGGATILPGGALWPAPGFFDVPSGEFFTEPVQWLAAHGITSGVRPGYFDPQAPVTRGQMAAFLWRTMDQPSSDDDCGFADVDEGRYFSAAVCWLKENGITVGVGGNGSIFAPDAVVKRSEMALFLWRLTGKQPALATSGFADVARNATFSSAVDWLREAGITNGVSARSFDPAGRVSRGQMAAFLHRLASNAGAWPESMRLPSSADGELRCLAIGVCPPGDGSPPEPDDPGTIDPAVPPNVIGLRTRQAIERLVEAGFGARVVERDGTSLPVTMDFRDDRVNLSVVDDVVVSARVG